MQRLLVFVAVSPLIACTSRAAEPPIDTFDAIDAAAEVIRPELIALRRDLHRNPELSLAEARTADAVAQKLRALDLEVRTGVGGHGVVGILHGALPGPVVGYRADMDAMPMQEPAGRDYGSLVPGVFHVCGHDLHTAIGVGIASVLSGLRDQLHGTAVFVFQPAEETLEGAASMIEAGALADPTPEVIYAVHSWPFPVGTITQGTVFAGLDRFTIQVVGADANADIAAQLKASLAAIGTVAIPRTPAEIAQALAAMQDSTGPFASFVFLSQSSTLTAGSLVIRGSIKASSNAMYPALRQAVRDAASHVLDLAAYTLTFVDPSFPSMTSDPRVSANAAAMLARAVGDAHVLTLRTSWPFNTEDFALFLEYDPGAMFLLGVANPAKGFSGVPHSPDFDADEDAILIGTKAMTAVIWQRLSGG